MVLQDPEITWLVKRADSEKYTETEDYYAGSYNKNTPLSIDFKIWNNRYGTKDVQDLKNFAIAVSFDFIEDSLLLDYCSFVLNNEETLAPVRTKDGITVQIPPATVLSGKVNDGTDVFTSNYLTLRMTIDVSSTKKIKANDLKYLSFDIVSL